MPSPSSDKERIIAVFNELRADNVDILDAFYAQDAHFVDPIGEHNGIKDIKKYYKNIYKNVQSIRFDFSEVISEGNQHSATWTMYLRAKGLNSGKEVVVKGVSIIRFENGLVSYHRDYFDMGEFIYDYVPILNWLIKQVKGRLKSS